MLDGLRDSPFWDMKNAESLCRTSIDLVLFERLSAHQEMIAARQLFLKAERPLIARTTKGKTVTGDVDYALGYEAEDGPGTKNAFESTLIVVEAKKKITFDAGLAQCASYLGTPSKPSFIFVN